MTGTTNGAGYTVTEVDAVRLVRGSVPAECLGQIFEGTPKKALLDPHAARLLGVTFAIGERDALEALCRRRDVLEEAMQRAKKLVVDDRFCARTMEWLAYGEWGASSVVIFNRLLGSGLRHPLAYAQRVGAHPEDVSELVRCRRLVESVPGLRERLGEMTSVSQGWARVVAAWDELCKSMDEECPRWRERHADAPMTRKLLKAALSGERIRAGQGI